MDKVSLITSPLLDVKGLTLKYPGADKPVLDDISFTLNQGEVCFIAGANSSGKSSLLMALAGLFPSSVPGEAVGTILIKNQEPGELAASLCVQDRDVYLFEDVFQEIAYPILNASCSAEDTEKKVRYIAELAGINELLHRKMSTLSGGERQKVAIAAALACDRDIILLDEPFEQFDPDSVNQILHSLKRYTKETNRALILTAKRYEYAEGFADRVFSIESGKLAEIENPVYSYQCIIKKGETGDSSCICEKSAPLISFRNVTYKYSKDSGISGIDLSINKGEITGIMGPNGAGKTTLLKHCIGLLKPQEGSVLYSGNDIKDIPVHRLAFTTGMLFQNPDDQIFNERADLEVAWGLVIRGVDKKTAVKKAAEMLDEFGLSRIAKMHPHSLSRSMRQVIALASVLVTEPDILILDEPTGTMDDSLIKRTMRIITRYVSNNGAVVIISHDPSVIWNYTDRCFLMDHGEIIASGLTGTVLTDPEALKICGLKSHPFIEGIS